MVNLDQKKYCICFSHDFQISQEIVDNNPNQNNIMAPYLYENQALWAKEL